MKSITTIFLTFLMFQFGLAQTNWDKIDLGNWGEIKMPNTMEVQSGNYKKILDYSKRHFSLNAERIVFQQKVVNDGRTLETYARIIIRTDFTNESLPDLHTTNITSHDIADLNQIYNSAVYAITTNL